MIGGIFMPNMNWSKLNSMQFGRYSEYYEKIDWFGVHVMGAFFKKCRNKTNNHKKIARRF